MHDNTDWSEPRVTQLRKLWADGLSALQIGQALRLSKNAVIGKVHRLGLEGRPSPIRRDGVVAAVAARPPVVAKVVVRRVVAAPVAKPARIIAAAEPAPAVAPISCAPVSRVAASLPGCCKFPLWPHGAVKATGPFCNARIRRAGSPYCEAHRAIAYQEA